MADITPPVVFHFGSVERLPWISVALLLAVGGTVNFWYDGIQQISIRLYQLTAVYRAEMYGQFDPKWLYILCVAVFEAGIWFMEI